MKKDKIKSDPVIGDIWTECVSKKPHIYNGKEWIPEGTPEYDEIIKISEESVDWYKYDYGYSQDEW